MIPSEPLFAIIQMKVSGHPEQGYIVLPERYCSQGEALKACNGLNQSVIPIHHMVREEL